MEQKFCEDCKWYEYYWDNCKNPNVIFKEPTNLVKRETNEVKCITMRKNILNSYEKTLNNLSDNTPVCGPEGKWFEKWFEPKNEKKSWFTRFRDWWIE